MKTILLFFLLALLYSCGLNDLPEPSMEKELLVGDFLFINKLDSNAISDTLLNNLSYPLIHDSVSDNVSILLDSAIISNCFDNESDKKRNDIVVFQNKKN